MSEPTCMLIVSDRILTTYSCAPQSLFNTNFSITLDIKLRLETGDKILLSGNIEERLLIIVSCFYSISLLL